MAPDAASDPKLVVRALLPAPPPSPVPDPDAAIVDGADGRAALVGVPRVFLPPPPPPPPLDADVVGLWCVPFSCVAEAARLAAAVEDDEDKAVATG